LETALPLGVKALSIHMDDQGLIPEHLDNVLSSWDEKERKARKPFLLYMVPTGQNPTGATQSLERRKMIYALAQKHSLYIVEDEPYYYIQLPPFGSSDSFSNSKVRNELIPSYLSLDVDGRVLRLDSLSKVLAPGSRMGWVTASEQVIEKFVRLNESSSQHPSGFSQVIVFKLLNHHWGHSGFFGWLEKVQAEYTSRRDTFVQACLEHLPADITSWIPSEAGMFVSEHPSSWARIMLIVQAAMD
jgi:aromatic amino acid aminotransferase I